jgi:ubiquinone/menaquinone biosynthesis C-methylase UbiE
MPSFTNKILDLSAALGLYDRWARRSLGQVHETLIELVDPHTDEKILDVGCGTGMLSLRLANTAERIAVWGVDIGPRMIRVARKRVAERHPNVGYHVGTAVRLAYPNGQFDVVSSCLLFHLLDGSEKERALQEIFRVLKPGGRYICAEFRTHPVGFIRRELAEYPSGLIGAVGFDIQTECDGPFITRHRPVVYRVLVRPK